MHCGSCALGIQMLLQHTPGVSQVTADYPTKSGQVEFDPEKVSFAAIQKTIAELGYQATTRQEQK